MKDIKIHNITGVALSSDADLLVQEPPDKRLYVMIQCILATGVTLTLSMGHGASSATWGYIKLEPGDIAVFYTRKALAMGMPADLIWEGNIYATGSGGTAGYQGMEVYLE